MCADSTKQAKTIIENIKKILYNCDLTIAYAKSEISIREATMKLYEGSRNKYKKRKFIEAKIDKERFEMFIEDVEHTKDEIMDNLNIILDRYQSKYKQVFIAYFLENRSYTEIADITNYSLEAIKVIIRKLKTDLLTFYML